MDRRNQTEKLLNAAMDHLAETLEQPTDPRAWDYLLSYCPHDALDRRLTAMKLWTCPRCGYRQLDNYSGYCAECKRVSK